MSLNSDTAARLATLAALGLDTDTIVFPESPRADVTAAAPSDGFAPITDAEWSTMQRYLPAEAPQGSTMSNRAFIDTVLWVFTRGKAWTQVQGEAGEAVRRRFARWAHAGHWKALYDALRGQGLSARRESQLAAIAKRAARLCARVQSQRATD